VPKDWADWAIAASCAWQEGLGATPFPSDRVALAPCCDFHTIRVRQIAQDHTIGNVVADAGLLALILERHLDGKPGCLAGTSLRDSRACDCCLLCSDRLSLVAKDRPHFCVAILGAAYADAPASWLSWPGLVSVFRSTLHHWARALHARQAGSRLPLTVADGRSQISCDVRGSGRFRERPPALPARCA